MNHIGNNSVCPYCGNKGKCVCKAIEVKFRFHEIRVRGKEYLQNAINNPKDVMDAFTWILSEQKGDFWAGYCNGRNLVEGERILTEMIAEFGRMERGLTLLGKEYTYWVKK